MRKASLSTCGFAWIVAGMPLGVSLLCSIAAPSWGTPTSSEVPRSTRPPSVTGTAQLNCSWTTLGQFESFSSNAGSDLAGRPPDPNGAVGPNHLVSIINFAIGWHTKNGVAQCFERLENFFSQLAPVRVFDPRVIYDSYAGRFVVTVADEDAVNQTSRILIAVSDDDNPNGTWHFQAIDATITVPPFLAYGVDQPILALDEEAIYITGNMFSFGGEAYWKSRVWILNKALYNGGVSTWTVYDPAIVTGVPNYPMAPAQVYGVMPSGIGTYLVRYSGFSDGGIEHLSVIRVDSPLTTPVFAHQWIPVDNIDLSSDTLPAVPQLGSATTLEAGDRRAQSAVWRDGRLFVAAQVKSNSGADNGQVTAHWWIVATQNPSALTLVEQGNIGGEDIQPGTRTFYPAIMVDIDGNVGIGFSAAGPLLYPGAYYTLKLSSFQLGQIGPSQIVSAGVNSYAQVDVESRNRWGDYSGLALDPNDSRTFWAFNMYTWTQNEYGTRWLSFGYSPVIKSVPGDYNAIQLAIDNSQPGYVVDVDGNYVNDGLPSPPITMKPGVIVRGKLGTPRPVINAGGQSTAVTFPGNSTPGTVIQGFAIKGFSQTGVLQLTTLGGLLSSVRVENCTITGGQYGIWGTLGRLQVRDSDITGQSLEGIIIEDAAPCGSCDSTVIERVAIGASGNDGIVLFPGARPIAIRGSTITGWTNGIRFNSIFPVPTFRIEDNIIQQNGVGLDCRFMAMLVRHNDVFGNTTQYKDCGAATLDTNISEDALFCNSRESVVGKYTLRIDSPCTDGNSPWGAQIGAKSVECAWGALVRPTTNLKADEAVTVLEDLTIPSGKTLTMQEGASLKFDDDDTTPPGGNDSENELLVVGTLDVNGTATKPVRFTSFLTAASEGSWAGIIGKSGGHVDIDHADIQYAKTGVASESGVNILKILNSALANNQVSDVTAAGNSQAVITITANNLTVGSGSGIVVLASQATVNGNMVTGNEATTYGIDLEAESANQIVSGNTVQGVSAGPALYVGGASGSANKVPSVRKNTLKDSLQGIKVAASKVAIGAQDSISERNTITGNSVGISCEGSIAKPTIRSNEVSSNTTHGIVAKSGANPDIGKSSSLGGNKIINNGTYCIYNRNTTGTISAQGNYLGSIAGCPLPACFSGSVDISGWLCAAPFAVDIPIAALPDRGEGLRVQGFSPNPTRSGGRLSLSLQDASAAVGVEVFDVTGRKVKDLTAPLVGMGKHEITWLGDDFQQRPVRAGIYFIRVRGNRLPEQTIKVLVVR